jgi:hypothetical protein
MFLLRQLTRVAVAALLGVGCKGIAAVCPIDPFPAVEVEVRYASNDEPAWWGARGIVQEGTFIDSLVAASDFAEDSVIPYLLAAAFDRPGTYDVTVERDGFQTVEVMDVTAGVDAGCQQVIPARVQVRLEPVP